MTSVSAYCATVVPAAELWDCTKVEASARSAMNMCQPFETRCSERARPMPLAPPWGAVRTWVS